MFLQPNEVVYTNLWAIGAKMIYFFTVAEYTILHLIQVNCNISAVG